MGRHTFLDCDGLYYFDCHSFCSSLRLDKKYGQGKTKDQTISRFRISAAIIALLFVLILAIAPFISPVDHTNQDRGRNAPGVEFKK